MTKDSIQKIRIKMQNLYEGTVLEEGFPRNDKAFLTVTEQKVIQELKVAEWT